MGIDMLNLDGLIDGVGPFICTEQKISQQECASKELGLFVKLHQHKSHYQPVNRVLGKNEELAYPVVEEGVYCAVVYSDKSSIAEYSITTRQQHCGLRLDQYAKWIILGQLVVPLCLVVFLASTYRRSEKAVLHYYCIAVFANKLSSAVISAILDSLVAVSGSQLLFPYLQQPATCCLKWHWLSYQHCSVWGTGSVAQDSLMIYVVCPV